MDVCGPVPSCGGHQGLPRGSQNTLDKQVQVPEQNLKRCGPGLQRQGFQWSWSDWGWGTGLQVRVKISELVRPFPCPPPPVCVCWEHRAWELVTEGHPILALLVPAVLQSLASPRPRTEGTIRIRCPRIPRTLHSTGTQQMKNKMAKPIWWTQLGVWALAPLPRTSFPLCGGVPRVPEVTSKGLRDVQPRRVKS